MYKSQLLPLFLLLVWNISTITAQSANEHKCGLDLMQERLIQQNTDAERAFLDYQDQMNQYSEAQTRSNTVITLPVVVHVVHTGQNVGQAANLSESRIISQINALNRDYRRQNGDANNTPSIFATMAVDTEIEFCLASKDPNGNATSGIIRRQYAGIANINFIENFIKPGTQWDPKKYVNIWVVPMPDANILGYSYLPSSNILGSDSDLDGLVISYHKFGDINAQSNGRTTAHEMGHYLGLQHPWGSNESCGSDDNVSDTPNTAGPYFGCPSFPKSSCSSSDMFMNYMDYVDDSCMNMFTQGQKNLMRSILNNQRASLIANANTVCNLNVSTDNLVSNNNIEVYPNPAFEELTIELDLEKNYQNLKITLLDRLGRVIYQESHKNQSSGQFKLNISDFSSGLYLLSVQTDSYQNTQKVMILN